MADTTAPSTTTTGAEEKDKDDYIKTKALNVELGIRVRIDQLIDIDTSRQEYVVKGMLDRDWIATDEDLLNHKTMGAKYKPSVEVDIDFINDVSLNEMKYAIDPVSGSTTRLSRDANGVWYNRQRIEFNGRFAQEFNVRSFPFDVQDLSLVFSAAIFTAKQLTFVPMHTEVSSVSVDRTFSAVRDFAVVRTDVFTKNFDHTYADTMGHVSDENDVCPYVVFRVQVKREWSALMHRIVVWLFILGALSLGVLSYPHADIDGRLGFLITMILTLVAFQFVMQSELPRVAYFTLIDKYYVAIFSINIILIVESIVVGHGGKGLINDAKRVDETFAIVAAIVFAVVQVFFMGYAAFLHKKELAKIGKTAIFRLDRLTNYLNLKENKGKYPVAE